MRTTMTTVIVTICLALAVITILTVNNFHTRKNEVEESLSVSLNQAMEALKFEEREYTPENYEELVSDLLQQVIFQISSDCDVEINILTVDLDNGIVDVEAIAYYKWAGSKRDVSVRRTIMLEEYKNIEDVIPDNKQEKTVHVRFMSSGILYTEIDVLYGEPIPKPEDPGEAGWRFAGWYVQGDESRDVLTDLDWEDLCPSEDITFIAKYVSHENKI